MTSPGLRLIGALAACLCLAALSGCEAEPPQLPPAQTMAPEIAALALAPDEAKYPTDTADTQHAHFSVAWSHFDWITQYLVEVVAIPISATQRAEGQDAQRYSSDVWQWSIKMLAFDITMLAQGDFRSGYDVTYQTDGPDLGLNDFDWVTGHFSTDLTAGNWLFYGQSYTDGDNSALQVDWEIVSETERTLLFTNVRADDPAQGHTWEFSRAGNLATVTYENPSSEDWSALISWDINTGVGSIQANAYRQGELSCWNTDFIDVECPSEDE